MRRIYRGARNAFYIIAAGTTALATGVQHGRLSAALEADSPDVAKLRRRYLRARGMFCSVMQRASRCDRPDAEDMADAAGFPARAAYPADLH